MAGAPRISVGFAGRQRKSTPACEIALEIEGCMGQRRRNSFALGQARQVLEGISKSGYNRQLG